MNHPIERLMQLRVQDIISADLTTLHERQSLAEAAQLLTSETIGGAPVVNDAGECVGMLSGADFVKCCTQSRRAAAPDELATVSSFMSPHTEAIDADDLMVNAARRMCGSHIHRLVVVDRQRRPVGVITALDVVSALVLALEN